MNTNESQTDRAIETAIRLLGESPWEARALDKHEAVYVWEPLRGGRALIVGKDGSVLFAASSVAPADHEQMFADGERTSLDRFEQPMNSQDE